MNNHIVAENRIVENYNILKENLEIAFNRKITKARIVHSLINLGASFMSGLVLYPIYDREVTNSELLSRCAFNSALIFSFGFVGDFLGLMVYGKEEMFIDTPDLLPYNKLKSIPENYNINELEHNAICPISGIELKENDTVLCEKQLYSYEALKRWHTYKYNTSKMVPHTGNIPLKWDENVYKLPRYPHLDQ